MTLRRIVVVGNGIAGLTACDALRSAGFDGELTVVGSERHHPYSRPALSKALLYNEQDVQAHELPEPSHEGQQLLGVSATGLKVDAGSVLLDTGDELAYDGLVIASGARAKRLLAGPRPAGSTRELTLRTLEDAIELKHAVASQPTVIVVGGGALGMEVASGCLQAGCDVTLVTDAPPLSLQLGDHLSALFLDAAVGRGLRVVTGGRARLLDSPAGTKVVLSDGTELKGELIVTAIGDEPNVEWLAGSGLLKDGTLQVDSRGRVSTNIVAAGDVAFFPTTSGLRRVPLWTSAIDQAKIAAVGLLAGDAAPEFKFQPYFWTEGFGMSLKAVGFTPVDGAPEYSESGATPASNLMRWGHADGSGTAAALNYRIPIPKLRRLANSGSPVLAPG